jgi:S1-C subfamily serine protease
MSQASISAFPVALAICLAGLTEASAQERCRLADPTGTPLNIRNAPNGSIIGTLTNGTMVAVLNRASDRQSRAWAYIGTSERKAIGWVFRDYLDCRLNTATAEFQIFPGKAFRYTGQDTFTIGNADDCQMSCALDASCVAFTYFRNSKQCRPMQAATALSDNRDADSGIRLLSRDDRRPDEAPARKPIVPSVVSSGSGFFVSREGHIVTNAHLVRGCVEVRSSRGGRIKPLAIDEQSDLALYLAVEKPSWAARLRGGRGPRAGEAVVAIGFPLRGLLGSDPIVTTGTISALAGLGNDRRTIQITAPVQPGNSGGPLLGENGSVVGVVVAKLDAIEVAKVFGDIPQNVNFAVSLGTLQPFLNANAVPYVLDDSTVAKTSIDIAAEASGYTVSLDCLR